MTLPSSSSAISMQQINTEFGRGNDLNSYRGTTWSKDDGTSGTFSSSAISFDDFHSKRLKPASIFVDYLLIAGGGTGGGFQSSGGGGAGGYITGSTSLYAGTNYDAVIGAGGAPVSGQSFGNNGGNSTFLGLTAIGGGGGGYGYAYTTINGRSGGSGGGAAFAIVNYNGVGGAGTAGQGNNAANANSAAGSGGGGAGGPSPRPAYGGPGGTGGAPATWLDGIARAGGGGGYSTQSGAGVGGGGGAGNASYNTTGADATPNTGSGSGGVCISGTLTGRGGSGVAAIRYAGSTPYFKYTGPMTTTITGGYVYHYLNGSGTLSY
jgi:hypothetical protein